jgi:hypothetical protein
MQRDIYSTNKSGDAAIIYCSNNLQSTPGILGAYYVKRGYLFIQSF